MKKTIGNKNITIGDIFYFPDMKQHVKVCTYRDSKYVFIEKSYNNMQSWHNNNSFIGKNALREQPGLVERVLITSQ